ncbi:MAG: hypothetical protein MR852_11890 [Treponema sp.]|nr:hypothetical protein [Treponema sp.]
MANVDKVSITGRNTVYGIFNGSIRIGIWSKHSFYKHIELSFVPEKRFVFYKNFCIPYGGLTDFSVAHNKELIQKCFQRFFCKLFCFICHGISPCGNHYTTGRKPRVK